MHDLVIRNATIVDGTGTKAFKGDLAVDEGLITAVGEVLGTGKHEVDAGGLLLAPGWVDMHTHYDGQATWDPYLTPSGWHGVTTSVMGNCGVGFAPAKAEERDWVINLMEGVEDIPGAALHEGLQWEWETFPEFLDALERREFGMDIATQVPHGPLRAYVMGKRGIANDPATPEDISAMKAIVKEGIAAGALGFSTSRTFIHRSADGELMPGTFAEQDELFGIGEALGELDAGVFQMTSNHVDMDKEFVWLRKLSDQIERPACFNLLQTDEKPDLWKTMLSLVEDAYSDGSRIRAQMSGRPAGLLMGWRCTAHPFVFCPSWQAVAEKPWPELLELLRTPEFRETLLNETPPSMGDFYDFLTRTWAKMFSLGKKPNYEPTPDQSLAALAEAQGKSPGELAYDFLLEDEGEALIYFPIFNYSGFDMDPILTMLEHPHTRIGLGDGGAHCGAIQDASIPTYLLTHWVKGRTRGGRIELEAAIKKQTHDTAEFYGLLDRGALKPGLRADFNLIDLEKLELHAPRVVRDLPAGGRRLIQEVTGYVGTWVHGVQVYANGETTGALPGRLIRGAKQPAAVSVG